MSVKEKILAALRKHSRVCDDCLSEITGVTPRQTVNAECRLLSKRISRMPEACPRCKRVKLVNVLR